MNNIYIGKLDINEGSDVKVIDALHFAFEECEENDTDFCGTLLDQIEALDADYKLLNPDDTWAGQDAEGNAY